MQIISFVKEAHRIKNFIWTTIEKNSTVFFKWWDWDNIDLDRQLNLLHLKQAFVK